MRFLPFQLTAVVYAVLCLACSASTVAAVDEFDVQTTPQETDNFYESRARLWLPPSAERIAAAIVFLNGTDSDARPMVSNKDWQSFASKHQVALIGCHFRGDGEPYEEASKGSGNALLAMIKELSAKTNRPDLNVAPLVFIGHSAGAMFAYNFTCWKPNSVLAFISIKSGPISPTQNTDAGKVPGLFILGEKDLEGRVRTTANAYLEMNANSRLWALAVEPGGGHGSSEGIRNMIRVYLEDILSLFKTGFLRDGNANEYMQGVTHSLAKPNHKYQISGQPISDKVWLPGTESARFWQAFVLPVSLRDFAEHGGISDGQYQSTSRASIDLGDIDLRHGDSPLRKSFTFEHDVSPNHGFVSEDKRLHLISYQKRGSNDTLVTLGIDPDQLTPGILRSSFQITVGAGERLSFTVRARILANHRAKPASLYVGVIPRGGISEMHVSIIDDSASQVKIVSIRSSKPSFAEAKATEDGTLLCRFDGNRAFGNQSGHFEVMLAGVPERRLKIPFIAWVSKQRSL